MFNGFVTQIFKNNNYIEFYNDKTILPGSNLQFTKLPKLWSTRIFIKMNLIRPIYCPSYKWCYDHIIVLRIIAFHLIWTLTRVPLLLFLVANVTREYINGILKVNIRKIENIWPKLKDKFGTNGRTKVFLKSICITSLFLCCR